MRGYTRISVQIICISLTGRFMPLTKCYKNPRCKGKSCRARRVLSRLLCNHHHNLLFYISAPHNSPHLLFLAWALASRVEWGLPGRRVCACPSLNSLGRSMAGIYLHSRERHYTNASFSNLPKESRTAAMREPSIHPRSLFFFSLSASIS